MVAYSISKLSIFLIAIPFFVLSNIKLSAEVDESHHMHSDMEEEQLQAPPPATSSAVRVIQRHELRFNWSNLEPLRTRFGNEIERNQRYCHPNSNPTNSSANMKFWIRLPSKGVGLGNVIHRWSAHLCGALQNDAMVLFRGKLQWAAGASKACDAEFTRLHPWKRQIQERRRLDKSYKVPSGGYSYLSCFFNKESKTNCAPPEELPKEVNDPRVTMGSGMKTHIQVNEKCHQWLKTEKRSHIVEWRASSIEWLFSSVSDLVLNEAQRQIRLVFGDKGLPNANDLVTAHIRWGDARTKGKLVTMDKYIHAIHLMVGNRTNNPNPLHVYVATETPAALDEFMQQKHKDWIVHTSNIMTPRNNSVMGDFASGAVGLQSMGALLMSMEANYYVLTTTSHWSRLINELRIGVVDTRCGRCTKVVDLSHGVW